MCPSMTTQIWSANMGTYTPGPWYYITYEGSDFTAIASIPKLDNSIDLKYEVLGSSEWLRVTPDDLLLMSYAPEMLALLKKLRGLRDRNTSALFLEMDALIDKAEGNYK